MTPLLSLGALAAALLAVTTPSGSAAVLYLVGCFSLAACRMLVGGAGFVGFAYLLVYVGAIAILALFAVMLTEGATPGRPTAGLSTPLALLLGAGALASPLASAGLAPQPLVLPAAPVGAELHAAYLFGEAAPYTLLLAVLLLLAMAGSVALAQRL